MVENIQRANINVQRIPEDVRIEIRCVRTRISRRAKVGPLWAASITNKFSPRGKARKVLPYTI